MEPVISLLSDIIIHSYKIAFFLFLAGLPLDILVRALKGKGLFL